MIKRTLLWTLGWVALFIAGMQVLKPRWQDAPTQYRMHFERTQTLVQHPEAMDTVFVGSSLVATMDIYGLMSPRWYSMGLRGGSPHTGAWVTLTCAPTPKVLMIETNLLLMLPDTLVYRHACALPYRYLEKLVAFREVARPATLFQLMMAKLMQASSLQAGQMPQPDAKARQLILEENARKTRQQLRDLPEKKAHALELLGRWDSLAKEKGIKLLFVEFPYRASADLPRPVEVLRQAIRQELPHIPYFYLADTTGIVLPDASHMDLPSNRRFAQALRSWLAAH
ncbi:MAG: hypothetical protein KF690_08490 [Bacteroidetes bacterium]|nr:hypothetical protein [Bacteroidota bacterium]